MGLSLYNERSIREFVILLIFVFMIIIFTYERFKENSKLVEKSFNVFMNYLWENHSSNSILSSDIIKLTANICFPLEQQLTGCSIIIIPSRVEYHSKCIFTPHSPVDCNLEHFPFSYSEGYHYYCMLC